MEKNAENTAEVQVNNMVKVRIPRDKNGSKGLFVSVNNHRYFIPRGETVEVPDYIAEVIENSIAQDDATAAMIDSLTRSFDA